jgi:hypothetical protein
MDFVAMSIFTHILVIYLLLGVMLFNYVSLFKITNFVKLANRLKFMTPIYHGLNACVAYTGMIVAAYAHDLSLTVILMIVTSVLIMILEIKRYKKMRTIRSKDFEQQKIFIAYAKNIYVIEMCAVIFTFVVSKIF